MGVPPPLTVFSTLSASALQTLRMAAPCLSLADPGRGDAGIARSPASSTATPMSSSSLISPARRMAAGPPDAPCLLAPRSSGTPRTVARRFKPLDLRGDAELLGDE